MILSSARSSSAAGQSKRRWPLASIFVTPCHRSSPARCFEKKEEEVIHLHVLLIREVRLSLPRVLKSQLAHPIPGRRHERLIVASHFCWRQPLPCRDSRSPQISPARDQVIERRLRLPRPRRRRFGRHRCRPGRDTARRFDAWPVSRRAETLPRNLRDLRKRAPAPAAIDRRRLDEPLRDNHRDEL
jgi:hypothetical protein